jgi:hypothetical protein
MERLRKTKVSVNQAIHDSAEIWTELFVNIRLLQPSPAVGFKKDCSPWNYYPEHMSLFLPPLFCPLSCSRKWIRDIRTVAFLETKPEGGSCITQQMVFHTPIHYTDILWNLVHSRSDIVQQEVHKENVFLLSEVLHALQVQVLVCLATGP